MPDALPPAPPAEVRMSDEARRKLAICDGLRQELKNSRVKAHWISFEMEDGTVYVCPITENYLWRANPYRATEKPSAEK